MNWKDHPLHCECEECASPDQTYAGKRGAARGLIEQLIRRGVSFKLAGDRLRLFPKDSVEDEDLKELRRLKLEVLALLSEDEARRRRGGGMCATCWRSSIWPGSSSGRMTEKGRHERAQENSTGCGERWSG